AWANTPPAHGSAWPGLGSGSSAAEVNESLELGPELQRGASPKQLLQERRKLDQALDGLQRQRRGIVDAYVVTIALDSDPVFAREAREAGRVLSRRYNANGRTMVLAGPDGIEDNHPKGSITSLMISLARIAELMDPSEDVLVLYTTSHGAPEGLAYHYGDTGFGILSPRRLSNAFEELGFDRRILLISACYSGAFIPALASENTAILTASAANRTSFGCQPDNDWTFFGDALINRALRKPQPLAAASQEANLSIVDWESRKLLLASLPQTHLGDKVEQWLPALEARIPRSASRPVGKPAFTE
ncbi:MAG TPA: peptidase C13, partial [Erythrobacter sp.]|nr:peptidase C13 [Erythrobacter sp.]